MKAYTQEEIIARAVSVHGSKYSYDKLVYVNRRTKFIITCPLHGDFEQRASNHIYDGHGCPKCAILSTYVTQEDFITRAKAVHQDTYDYSRTKYVGSNSLMTIVCTTHGPFTQAANVHLKGHGCPLCGVVQRTLTMEDFYIRCQERHGDMYDYSQTHFSGAAKSISIICKQHGAFTQRASDHMKGHGCPQCAACKTYSQAAIQWLDYRAKQDGVIIKHAANGGEHVVRLPNGKSTHVDGFSVDTRHVYEFHGVSI